MEQNRPLLMAFIDLVNREALYVILRRVACPQKLLQVTQSFHDGMQASVQFEGTCSDPCDITNGAKQSANIVWNLLLCLSATRLPGTSWHLSDHPMSRQSQQELQSLCDAFAVACSDFGVTISISKIKVMSFGLDVAPLIQVNGWKMWTNSVILVQRYQASLAWKLKSRKEWAKLQRHLVNYSNVHSQTRT